MFLCNLRNSMCVYGTWIYFTQHFSLFCFWWEGLFEWPNSLLPETRRLLSSFLKYPLPGSQAAFFCGFLHSSPVTLCQFPLLVLFHILASVVVVPWLSPETCIPQVISFSLMTLNTIDPRITFRLMPPVQTFPWTQTCKTAANMICPCMSANDFSTPYYYSTILHPSQSLTALFFQLVSCMELFLLSLFLSCPINSNIIIYTFRRYPDSHQFTPLPYCHHDFSLELLQLPLNWSSVSIVYPFHSLQSANFIHKLDPATPYWE